MPTRLEKGFNNYVPRIFLSCTLGYSALFSYFHWNDKNIPKKRPFIEHPAAILENLKPELAYTPIPTPTTIKPTTTTEIPTTTTTEPTTSVNTVTNIPNLLRRIAGCESDGAPYADIIWNAQNPTSTASGGFQIEDGTWADFDGYAKAKYAPPSIQTQKAEELLAERGTEPWLSSESCWG